MSIFDRIVEYSNISKPNERVPKEDGGMLVQPSDDGSRPGYKGPKQQFKPVEGAPSRVQFDTDKQLYRKMVQETVGGVKKNKYIYSEPGESLEQFMGRKPIRSTGADDATVQARQFIDNWTKNWFDENLKNYDVKNFDEMLSKLSNDWETALESENVPKGSRGFKLKTSKLGLPNITTLADAKIKSDLTPFEYNGVRFYKNLEGDPTQLGKTLAQYKKVFYKNQIENNPKLRKDLNKFFDFMSSDKRGQYKKLDGKTIKQFMDTEVSDDVKFLLNDKASGLGKDSKFEVFNSYDDLADNYNTFTQDKARLKAVQIESESISKVGEKTKNQYLKVKESIKNQNDVLAKMSVEDIAKNKKLLNSVRMVINPISGEVSYTNYTVNDPKGKPALDDMELAKKIKQKALDKKFFVTEHISKRSLEKLNTAFPNNIQLANYMSNVQLENARSFLSNSQNRVTEAAQNLDKALEQTGLTIRGPEYGGQRYGNKIDIIYDSQTGRSNIIDSQSIGGQQFVKTGEINKTQRANLLNAFCEPGRSRLSKGTNPDGLTCSMEEVQRGIQKETEKAKRVFKDGRIPKKFGKLRALGTFLFGVSDPAIEFMFAAPYLVAGDVEGAKAATTAGLFGAGKRDIENMSDKEAQRYVKHIRATEDWMNNYFTSLETENQLKNLQPNTGAFELATNQLNQAKQNMENIADDYGKFGYSFKGADTPLSGKVAMQKYIRDEVAKDFDKKVDKGASTLFFKDSDPNLLRENIRSLGGDPKTVSPIVDLESYMANKGEPMAGNENILFNVKPYVLDRAFSYGLPELFDDYAAGAGVEKPGFIQQYKDEQGETQYDIDMGRKSLQDAYSEIPLEFANQLAALEKKQLEEGLLQRRLTGFAGGGIAGLSGGVDKGTAPVKGPQSQGLSYLMKRGINS